MDLKWDLEWSQAGSKRLIPPLPPPRAIYDGPRVDSWTDAADASEGGGPAPSIEVQNRSDQDTTLVRCGGFNRTGQLAALTIAISSFGLQIKSTFIRTDNDAADVDDLFYVQTREGEPVPLDQHDALVRHVERALGLPPSAVDTLQAARDAGFIGHAAHGSNDGSNGPTSSAWLMQNASSAESTARA